MGVIECCKEGRDETKVNPNPTVENEEGNFLIYYFLSLQGSKSFQH